jgi:hypothetical protein
LIENPLRKLIVALPLLLAGPLSAVAAPAQPVDETREICLRETRAAERSMGIPQHLLSAIALAETGRWDDESRASFAWPWTVMAQGRGRYFPTKREAVAEVRRLAAQGITNIDVGCMQINLYYHGSAFADVAEALDPGANVAYAGEYLKSLFASTRSWTQAAAFYHSTTPDLSAAYKRKVVELWNRTRRGGPADTPAGPSADRSQVAKAPPAGPDAPPARAHVSIDMARTAELNARLRLARAEERTIDAAARRRQDLAYWREAQAAALPTRHVALMRRAQAAAERNRELLATPQERTQTFAERRRDQLRRWRLSHPQPDDAS